MPTKLNRRTLLQGGLGAAGLFAIGQSGRAAGPTFAVDEIRTISQQPNQYHGWPTVARRKSGELLLVCSGGREQHVCPFGRVELMRSKDDGKTWTWPQVVIDTAIDDRDAGVLETNKGTILITTFTSLAFESNLSWSEREIAAGKKGYGAEKTARWQSARDRLTPDQRKASLGVWMIRSTDNGVSWSARYDCLVDSPHGPFQLLDGRQLYAGVDLWRPGREVHVCESKDDGQTWQVLGRIPARSGDDAKNYHELHGVEANDGRIVVQIRNHNKANSGETLQTHSTDGGKTWSVPRSIGVWGLPSHLLRLIDGRLLMTYGHRRAPLGNQARISSDNGQTWSEAMIFHGNATSGDLGYPSTVQLGDGSLVSIWYESMKGSDKAVLRQAHWRLTG